MGGFGKCVAGAASARQRDGLIRNQRLKNNSTFFILRREEVRTGA